MDLFDLQDDTQGQSVNMPLENSSNAISIQQPQQSSSFSMDEDLFDMPDLDIPSIDNNDFQIVTPIDIDDNEIQAISFNSNRTFPIYEVAVKLQEKTIPLYIHYDLGIINSMSVETGIDIPVNVQEMFDELNELLENQRGQLFVVFPENKLLTNRLLTEKLFKVAEVNIKEFTADEITSQSRSSDIKFERDYLLRQLTCSI